MFNDKDYDKDYYLNPRIKRTDLEETYSEEQLLEYVKCSEDPKYFIENYVEINTLDHGFVKFKLRGYQEELIDCFNDNSKSIILSSRQSGKCIVFNTLQTIKNKKTGRIETITIGDFFNRIKLNENNNPILFNNLIHSPQSSSTKNKLSDNVERKFIESYDIEDYEVLTDTGFWPINYLHKTIEYETWEIVTDSRNLQCADTHIVFDPEYNEIFVKDLIPNKSLVITDRGPEIVRSVKNLGFLENMFDLTIDSEDHRFYTDGILSHNSITTASYILWYVFFHPDSTVYILANKAATAREILARVKAAYERTPFFLQPGASVWNKGSIELGNTSKIVAAATTSDSIRGQTANLVALDEFAFVENAEDFFKSTYPVISSGQTSKIIITSTPNGLNYFHKLWKDAEEKRSDFVSYEISWDKVPGRDEEWKRKQIALLGEHGFRQEYGNEFLGSSNTLISGNVLQSLTWETPLTISDDNVWKILEQPKEGHRYIVILDPSRGQEVDYTSMVVIDYTEIPYKIVATYHSNDIRPLLVPLIIVNLGKKYNEAYLLIERNSIGQAIVESCWYDLEYENIFGASTKDAGQRLTIGFGKSVKQGIEMTTPIKRIGCSNLKTLVEEKKLIGFTDDIFGELCTFVSAKNSWGASQGKHDDLVMCLVLFSWVSTQKFFKEFSELDIVSSLKNLLDDDELGAESSLPEPVFSNFNETNKYRRTSENSWLF